MVCQWVNIYPHSLIQLVALRHPNPLPLGVERGPQVGRLDAAALSSEWCCRSGRSRHRSGLRRKPMAVNDFPNFGCCGPTVRALICAVCMSTTERVRTYDTPVKN